MGIVGTELSRQNLNDCVELAEKYGLSKMTMAEINREIKHDGNTTIRAEHLISNR